ncbi:Uncharacterised protein [Streptococcus pneumoniae]|uniref:Uncharacterized protein n=1 Tax=Bacillus anthracis TaxID=1392 RepID=A0A0J1HJQ4_BACAN|nr:MULTISPECIES: hypothetical protein [Bacilli]AEW58689.1 hypothetical protein bcf_28000 [Bacillus cereus F837/76]KLV13982.1 hypothetical protein ABW01_29360 [Bacillus anthracis]KYZ64943.1 hypothetical protein A3782_26605 [Bacillus sp. GZT]MCU4793466.1 hypothetical protein [Bacillus cereus]MDA2046400.1 hypothetical protein [Bacillus cereus]
MVKKSVKFYVSEKEMERLKVLAEMRFMTIPGYVKLTALGVQVRQPKEIFLNDLNLEEEDKSVLKEILERKQGNGYISYDRGFNERLEQLAIRLLGEEE